MSKPLEPIFFSTCEAGLSKNNAGNSCVDFSVAVVLPAGGSGERTGLQTPKQFCKFLNRPLLSYTVQAFERVPWIESIAVVVAKENLGLMTDIIQKFHHRKVKVVHGGSTRHRSIFNGIQALCEGKDGSAVNKPKVVIIHDAVRPFVEEDFLLKIAMAAKEQGAAGAIRPLVSTVIATTPDGYLDHSLQRAKYRASEMPQGFLYDVIYQAYQRCSQSDFEFGTECLDLALQYCGTNAKLIEGPPTLWKVTYKRDLAAAESIIKGNLSQSACVITGESMQARDMAKTLQKIVGALEMQVDVIPDLLGDNARSMAKQWNFIQISVNNSFLLEVEEIIRALEETNQSLLYPVVIIWVHLNVSEGLSNSKNMEEPEGMMEFGRGAKLRNILLYGIQLHHSKEVDHWEQLVGRMAEVICALIQDRNPALTGQLLKV
ncbi:D-ribitol-5-phosphate cytidylyltransferase [Hypomesus transpacificus]|uniref:D-ribitol-5-phosphate cytidylyltransferase n=1 Tax=Hypomesus transpacificus TaxID=137520 RepID=UPI001F083A45|nr:D-ribitol-5-phosphate cytidylyltransferase [Hypomesus transpacificus]